MTLKTCRTCGGEQPEDSFYRRGDYLFLDCKTCCAARSSAQRSDPLFLRREKSAGFKYRYGITIEDAEELLRQQGGGCAICALSVTLETAHLDHDHHTLQVRGVLCRRCNTGLGHFRDNSVLLQTASAYVTHHRKEERCLASW